MSSHHGPSPAVKDAIAAGRQYVTIERAAEIAGLSIPTLRDWIKHGRLKHRRPGRRLVIAVDELYALLEGAQ